MNEAGDSRHPQMDNSRRTDVRNIDPRLISMAAPGQVSLPSVNTSTVNDTPNQPDPEEWQGFPDSNDDAATGESSKGKTSGKNTQPATTAGNTDDFEVEDTAMDQDEYTPLDRACEAPEYDAQPSQSLNREESAGINNPRSPWFGWSPYEQSKALERAEKVIVAIRSLKEKVNINRRRFPKLAKVWKRGDLTTHISKDFGSKGRLRPTSILRQVPISQTSLTELEFSWIVSEDSAPGRSKKDDTVYNAKGHVRQRAQPSRVQPHHPRTGKKLKQPELTDDIIQANYTPAKVSKLTQHLMKRFDQLYKDQKQPEIGKDGREIKTRVSEKQRRSNARLEMLSSGFVQSLRDREEYRGYADWLLKQQFKDMRVLQARLEKQTTIAQSYLDRINDSGTSVEGLHTIMQWDKLDIGKYRRGKGKRYEALVQAYIDKNVADTAS
ncbi:MAG: hypothetical protein M1828_005847 [Chrysothrix sp. TS-e1954]|nr:MAG: hypothetical protein M1828_005847 [Chrysothrix sp. TS-e1954]